MRALLAAVVALRFAGVWLVALQVLLATDPPVTPPLLARQFALFVAVPFLAEWVLRRPFRAEFSTQAGTWVVRGARRQIEVPWAAIAGVSPWRIPLPAPGWTVFLRSGKRLRERLEGLPRHWIEPWCKGLAPGEQRRAAFALARCGMAPWRWYDYAFKFAGFALLPALLAFHLHQHIAYGGFWGEYYLRGPLAYLRTWVIYYGTVLAYLLLYAGMLRSVTELLAWVLTVTTGRAERWRQAAERLCRLAYYAGVPSFLALRLIG